MVACGLWPVWSVPQSQYKAQYNSHVQDNPWSVNWDCYLYDSKNG